MGVCACAHACCLMEYELAAREHTHIKTNSRALSFSFSLSLSLTHTISLSLTHTHAHIRSACLILSQFLFHTRKYYTHGLKTARCMHSLTRVYVCSDSFLFMYHSLMCAVVRGLKRVRYMCATTHCCVP